MPTGTSDTRDCANKVLSFPDVFSTSKTFQIENWLYRPTYDYVLLWGWQNNKQGTSSCSVLQVGPRENFSRPALFTFASVAISSRCHSLSLALHQESRGVLKAKKCVEMPTAICFTISKFQSYLSFYSVASAVVVYYHTIYYHPLGPACHRNTLQHLGWAEYIQVIR